ILMYPAAQKSLWGLLAVTAVFGLVTLSTMMAVVLVSAFGISLAPLSRLERYTHTLAGGALFACGMAMQFLGL
ncbi:MAG: hypothetical protein U9N87_14385, partial [Planctomycetota bacterium]|nr:hypothetical protein [Planctomycetota bacterium]